MASVREGVSTSVMFDLDLGFFFLCYCAQKRGRAPVCLFSSVFEESGLGERSHEASVGREGGRGGGGWVGKSHLEARDEAGFHEQHLEFQRHHTGQTHSRPQQWGLGGWGGRPIRFILMSMTSRTEGRIQE